MTLLENILNKKKLPDFILIILTHFLSDELQMYFQECTDLSFLLLVFAGMKFYCL